MSIYVNTCVFFLHIHLDVFMLRAFSDVRWYNIHDVHLCAYVYVCMLLVKRGYASHTVTRVLRCVCSLICSSKEINLSSETWSTKWVTHRKKKKRVSTLIVEINFILSRYTTDPRALFFALKANIAEKTRHLFLIYFVTTLWIGDASRHRSSLRSQQHEWRGRL